MTAGPQEIRESVLRFIASSPQGKSAVEIVRVIAEKEKISSELVRRELLNLLERGEVALRTNL